MNINLTMIAQAVTFAAFIWFTAKFVWPPMLRAIEARQKTDRRRPGGGGKGKRPLETSSKQAEEAIAGAHGARRTSSARPRSAPRR